MLRNSVADLCKNVPNLRSGSGIGDVFPEKDIEPRLTDSGFPNLIIRKEYKDIWIVVIEAAYVPASATRLRGARGIKNISARRSAKDRQGGTVIG